MPLKLNSSGGGSVTLQEPTTASNRTLTLPDNTGTVITTASTFAGTGPAFSATNGSTQSLSNGVFTKAQISSEEFDTNSNFDSTTNYRFTPTVAGYYQFNARFYYGSGSAFEQIIHLFKNGTAFGPYLADAVSVISREVNGSRLVYLNGTTDYVEMYVYINTNATINANEMQFQAFLARAA
jgi:hypothetical protein